MLYIALRVIACLLILLISILGILKSKIHKKKLWISLAVAVSFIIASASYLVPIENLFLTFDTPEDAYFYTHPNEEVNDVIEGENSSMLVCENTYGFISNTENGYKILSAIQAKSIVKTAGKNGFVQVYHVNGTNDFYLWGSAATDTLNVKVEDTNGSNIRVSYKKHGSLNSYTAIFYGYMKNFSLGDPITITGAHANDEIMLS